VVDEELCTLADAEDLETWKDNRKVVLKKFQPFTDKEGRKLLRHKRLDRDWQQTLTYVEQKRKGGKARQARAKQESADAEQVLPDAPQTETENRNLKHETKAKKEMETKTDIQTETETEVGSVSVSDPSSIDGFSMQGNSASGVGLGNQAEELAALWAQARETNGNELSLDDRDPEEFLALLERGDPFQEIKQVLLWLPKSTYWDKPGTGNLRDLSVFLELTQPSVSLTSTISGKWSSLRKGRVKPTRFRPRRLPTAANKKMISATQAAGALQMTTSKKRKHWKTTRKTSDEPLAAEAPTRGTGVSR
jgi:hypothetical protein